MRTLEGFVFLKMTLNFLRIIIKSHGVKYCQKAGKINTARQIQAFEYDKEKKVLHEIINQN